jgi:hypothetical protein
MTNNTTGSERTLADLAGLIKAFGKRIVHNGPHRIEAIAEIERMFDIRVPLEYRQFMSNYGSLSIDDLHILGLEKANSPYISIGEAMLIVRLAHSHIPLNLLPIEDLGAGYFACVVCGHQKSAPAPVVLLNTIEPNSAESLPQLASGFRDYLYNRLVLMLDAQSLREGSSNHLNSVHNLSEFKRG